MNIPYGKQTIDSDDIQSVLDVLNSDFLTCGPIVKQFEDKLLDVVIKDMKRGKSEKEIKDLVIKMFTEFYGMMYQQRSMWQGRLRNA